MLYCRFVIASMVLFLAACSHVAKKQTVISDRNDEYKTASTVPLLKVPSHLKATTLNSDYEVPAVVSATTSQTIELLPPGSLAAQVAHKPTKKSS